MANLKIEFYLKCILIISFISIFSAYFIEYALGHQPCNLCLIERIPYGLTIFLITFNYFFNKNEKFIILLLLLIFLFSLIISSYHLGIEQGFFDESTVCGVKNAAEIRDSCKKIPINRILVETDAPFLAPVPFRGNRNEPSYITETIKKVAEIKSLELEEVINITTNNFFDLFKRAKL